MEIFPEKLIKIWNGWEIRGLVVLSLLLQIILIIFGSRRKYIAQWWISFIVWSVYLSADSVATIALGILASSGEEETGKRNLIQAFWAPFLLLHLGGPDTITSYSLEDNELWLRHLLGLIFEVGVAFYVYLRSWTNDALTFIAIPVFISGLVKYGERTWVLRSSSTKNFQDSLLFVDSKKKQEANEKEMKVVPREACPPPSTTLFHRADYLFKLSLYLFQDLILGFSELKDSHSIISSVSNSSEAFRLIEIELGLVYDVLYTKAPIFFSRSGLFLRCITFLSSVLVLVVFLIIIDGHRQYSTVDVVLTYILLGGAFVLEVYAVIHLIFSDQTMIWLAKSGNPPSINSVSIAINVLHSKFRNGKKRWSRLIGQYDLISSCLSLKTESSEFVKLLGIDELIQQMGIIRKEVNDDLEDAIFKHAVKKGSKIIDEIRKAEEGGNMGEQIADVQVVRDSLLGLRGNGVLGEDVFTQLPTEIIKRIPFIHSIVMWHIATDLCYYSDSDNYNNNNRSISKTLSDYMLHLLAITPNMLPKGNRSIMYAYEDTQRDIKEILFQVQGKRQTSSYSEKEACLVLIEKRITPEDMEKQMHSVTTKYSVLPFGCMIAQCLTHKEPNERWNMLSEVWIEILLFAATHSDWKEQAHQLRGGGEFITHVCLLAAHLGLNEQFQEIFHKFDD